MTIQITAPNFCAGIVVDSDRYVVEAAPILRYMVGWSLAQTTAYCWKRRWKIEQVAAF